MRMKRSRYYDLALTEARKSHTDLQRTLRLLKRAHARGDIRAAYALATWHLHGKGQVVAKSIAKAIPLLREASEKHHPDAVFDLAICYEKGTGVRKSERKAATLYLRAALLGDKQSLSEVGRCYYHGLGVKRDRRIAWVWFDRAAEVGVLDKK